MKTVFRAVAGCALVLSMADARPAAAQSGDTQPAVTLQSTGTFARGGEFTGTVTINRFEVRDNRIVAVGLVQGVLRRGGRTVGSALAGEVVWPVAVSAGGVFAASGRAPAAPQISRVAVSTGRLVPVQAGACPVLEVGLGPVDVNLLGAQVSLGAIALTLEGETGTPLGDLVCAVSDLLGNVAGLVNLLNNVLGLLTGLLGGLTGGLA